MCHVFVFFLSLVKFVFLYFCLPLYGEIKICIKEWEEGDREPLHGKGVERGGEEGKGRR